jgi:cytochrome c oxidase assembly protein Cox11
MEQPFSAFLPQSHTQAFLFFCAYTLTFFPSFFQVDMPVFFYIDPEYVNDPWLQKADTVTLSYTFFEAKEGVKFLPQGQAIPHLRTTPGNTVAA